MSGSDGIGNPWGSGPSTDTPARAARSNPPTASVAPPPRSEWPGTRGRRLQQQDRRERARTDDERRDVGLSLEHAVAMAQICRSGPSAVTEKPKSFGSWLRSTVSAMPFM